MGDNDQLELFITCWLPRVGRARNLYLRACMCTQPTRKKQILHKVFKKILQTSKLSIVKVSIIVTNPSTNRKHTTAYGVGGCRSDRVASQQLVND